MTKSAIYTTCQKVSAVLSDGPDPSADPVGYAEAQILPLKGIKAADAPLQHAIDKLSASYADYFTTQDHATSLNLRDAAKKLSSLCPGVVAPL